MKEGLCLKVKKHEHTLRISSPCSLAESGDCHTSYSILFALIQVRKGFLDRDFMSTYKAKTKS